MGLGNGHWDWGLGLRIGIGDWVWGLGFGIGIRDWDLGLGIGIIIGCDFWLRRFGCDVLVVTFVVTFGCDFGL